MVDPNMETAHQWAEALGRVPVLPRSLEDVADRARLVDAVDWPLVRGGLLIRLTNPEKVERLREVGRLSMQFLSDVEDETLRVNVILRLWSGCLIAAKTIAVETRSGPNTPELRQVAFSQFIDRIAETDLIFRAGVEAAPAFKRLRNDPYSLEGVPDDSPVRIYA